MRAHRKYNCRIQRNSPAGFRFFSPLLAVEGQRRRTWLTNPPLRAKDICTSKATQALHRHRSHPMPVSRARRANKLRKNGKENRENRESVVQTAPREDAVSSL